MRLGNLKVDFMPDDENVLGFSNRWYKLALSSAETYTLSDNLNIKVVSPVLLLATKLEAYRGRGGHDPLGSRDMEDILMLFDGRPELIEEIKHSGHELRSYFSATVGGLLEHPRFEYAVQSAVTGDERREQVLWRRLKSVCKLDGVGED
ncbi:MAG: hypothetical protein AAF404_15855 [Pseudomonadota bacterium]